MLYIAAKNLAECLKGLLLVATTVTAPWYTVSFCGDTHFGERGTFVLPSSPAAVYLENSEEAHNLYCIYVYTRVGTLIVANYLFTTDTKLIQVSKFYCPSM